MKDKEKLDRMKKFADAIYYAAQHLTTDASGLCKAMDEYHKFIIYEYNKQEPASDDLNTFAAYAFAKQIVNRHTEQMMKDAIEGEIIGYPKDIKGSFVRFPVYALKEVAHFPINGKVGDKVKVIIIKD